MKTKRTLFLAILLAILVGALFACSKDDSTSKPSVQQGSKKATAPQATEPEPAQEAQETASWPPPPPKGAEITLSQNLLAKNYYVIMDSSGSMGEVRCSGNMTKSEAAKIALAEFAKTVPPDANLGLAVFDGHGIAERVPLGLQNREEFISDVNATIPGDGTPLYNAILLGYQKLEDSARSQAGYGEYHLVIVTDGQPDPPNQDPTPVVNKILELTPVVIHTIGFCIGTHHPLNQPGRTIYKAANNPQELRTGLGDVLAESPDFDVAGFKN